MIDLILMFGNSIGVGFIVLFILALLFGNSKFGCILMGLLAPVAAILSFFFYAGFASPLGGVFGINHEDLSDAVFMVVSIGPIVLALILLPIFVLLGNVERQKDDPY